MGILFASLATLVFTRVVNHSQAVANQDANKANSLFLTSPTDQQSN